MLVGGNLLRDSAGNHDGRPAVGVLGGLSAERDAGQLRQVSEPVQARRALLLSATRQANPAQIPDQCDVYGTHQDEQPWHAHGFVILPAFIPAEELKSAVGELDLLFPSSEGFHDGTDPRRERFIGDEFAGIDTFPFASAEISLLAVNHRILGLAEALLDDGDIHIYAAEAWAKYTGACDYDQDMHRDYLNHTVLVPSTTPGCRQLEMFVFLTDVREELGPPHLVSRKHTADIPAVPNWFLRPGQESAGRFHDDSGSPELYRAETSGAGAAGTVIAFEAGTFHRGTQLTAPRGVRYSMHLGFRPSSLHWGHRLGWAARSFEREWVEFVGRATPRQLQVFGFPPPGHPYWTPETLAGVALRYPKLDLTPWPAAG